MRNAIVAVAVAVFLLAGCQRDPGTSPSAGPAQRDETAVQGNKVLKVKVAASGDMTADGETVTLEQLTAKLAGLKAAGGGGWYHRENPAGEPHPNALKVIKLIAENGLPVKLSAEPDFSDAVDEKGVSHPGKR